MEQNVQHQIKVGIFLAFGVLATVISILFLGGDRNLFTTFSRLKVIMPQAQGLNQGSVVSLSGINIGNVESITYSSEHNGLLIVLKIKSDFLNVIKKDATTELRTQGALGDKYIFLNPGSPASEIVENNSFIQAAKSDDILDIISRRGTEAEKIFEIINETLSLIKSMNNQGQVEKIMNNMVQVSSDLKDASHQAKQVLSQLDTESGKDLKQSAQHLNSLLSKINKGEGTLGALVNDRSLYNNIKSAFSGDNQSQYMKSVLRTSIQKSPSAP